MDFSFPDQFLDIGRWFLVGGVFLECLGGLILIKIDLLDGVISKRITLEYANRLIRWCFVALFALVFFFLSSNSIVGLLWLLSHFDFNTIEIRPDLKPDGAYFGNVLTNLFELNPKTGALIEMMLWPAVAVITLTSFWFANPAQIRVTSWQNDLVKDATIIYRHRTYAIICIVAGIAFASAGQS